MKKMKNMGEWNDRRVKRWNGKEIKIEWLKK